MSVKSRGKKILQILQNNIIKENDVLAEPEKAMCISGKSKNSNDKIYPVSEESVTILANEKRLGDQGRDIMQIESLKPDELYSTIAIHPISSPEENLYSYLHSKDPVTSFPAYKSLLESDNILPNENFFGNNEASDVMQNDLSKFDELSSTIDVLAPLLLPEESGLQSHLQSRDTVTLSLPVYGLDAENIVDLENVPIVIASNNGNEHENQDSLCDLGLHNDPDYIPSDSETSSSNNEDQAVQDLETAEQGKPKRGRKRKFGNLTREERSCKKYRYETFINFSNKMVEAKTFVDFNCQCTNKCQEKVTYDDRKMEFEKFKELGNYNSQNLFINAHVKEIPKKRSYKSMKEGIKSRPKSVSRVYSLNKIKVCREMFVKTLAISSKRVNTALSKIKSNSLLDLRGKQAGWNKISDSKLLEVKQCIDGIPKYISHYRRSQTTSLFLPPELNISKMYDLYVNGKLPEEVVSLPTFKKIFYSCYNLKFKSLKQDTCNKCDMYIAKQAGILDEEQKNTIKAEHDHHLEMSEDAQRRLKEDMKYASTEEKVECLTFDLEKTLPLPRVPTNIVFYKRQLWVYNCGIHSGTTGKGYCYTWVEGEAGRGAQEVGSCLLKHINKELPKGTEHLILWSDSCGGQNRNIKLVLFLKAILNDHPTLKKITHKFPIPGHSFLPNDDDFGKIENALKQRQYMYCPEDYFVLMEKCKKKNPLTVVRMMKEDFLSSCDIEKKITNRKKSTSNKDINWIKTRMLMIEKEKPMLLFMSQTFDGQR